MRSTIVVMISIGKRAHISDYTYPRLSAWACRHGYSTILVTHSISDDSVPPHFNKLVAHRLVPGFDRYIIVDDDLLLKKSAPAMEEVPAGYVGLCTDAVQSITEAPHVAWTANTGFIVTDKEGTILMEKAYDQGEYPFKVGDKSGLGIWGPYDQAILNDVLHKHQKIYCLNRKWNYQAVIEYYKNGKGWNYWRKNRLYRLYYYISTFVNPIGSCRKKINDVYGVHMTMGLYPKFFVKVHK